MIFGLRFGSAARRRERFETENLKRRLERAESLLDGWEQAVEEFEADEREMFGKVRQEIRKCRREIAHCERRIRDGGPCPRSEYERAKCIYESHLRFLDGLLPRPISPSLAERNPAEGAWAKRATSSGQFTEARRSGDVLKGVRREN